MTTKDVVFSVQFYSFFNGEKRINKSEYPCVYLLYINFLRTFKSHTYALLLNSYVVV